MCPRSLCRDSFIFVKVRCSPITWLKGTRRELIDSCDYSEHRYWGFWVVKVRLRPPYLRKWAPLPIVQEAVWWTSRPVLDGSGEQKNSCPTGIEMRILQPVTSRYKLPFVVSNTRTIREYIIGRNVGGTGRRLIWGNVSQNAWRDSEICVRVNEF
jgi:hypothetical protein